MDKIFFTILILGVLTAASPALAKVTDDPFLAAIIKLVQDFLPGEETPVVPSEEMGFPGGEEEFVDPREVQQVLKEIKDIKKELNRFAKAFKKIPNSENEINQINSLLGELATFESNINARTDLRDNIQEFRDAQIWEKVNVFRAKVEIPKEMTQWKKEIKKLDKIWTQKKYQNLGLDLETAKAKIEEVKTILAKVQEYYNSGNFESAMEEFDDLRQDFHPGEIVSVIQRTQDLMNRLKAVKNAEIRNQIKEAFSEAITNFNEGEYRVARELLDENFNAITALIYKASSVGKKKGLTKEAFLQMAEKLEEQLRGKAEEKKEKMEATREEMSQPTP